MDGYCSTEIVGRVKQLDQRENFTLLRIELSQIVRNQMQTEEHDCILPGNVTLRGGTLAVDSIVHVRGPLKSVMRAAPAELNLPPDVRIPMKEIVITEGLVLGRDFPDIPF